MNVVKMAKTRKRSCKEKMKEKCNECLLWSAEWFTRLILILLVFSFYAIIFLETFDGNIGFGAFLFSVDFPIIAPKINLPAVYMNLTFQIINKIRLILAIVVAFSSKSLTAISKLSVDKDLVADIENGGVENNDDVEEDEGENKNAADDAKEQVENMKEDVEELIDEEEDEKDEADNNNADDDAKDQVEDIKEKKEKNDKKEVKKVEDKDPAPNAPSADDSGYKTPSKDNSASDDFSLPTSRRRSSRSRRRSSVKKAVAL